MESVSLATVWLIIKIMGALGTLGGTTWGVFRVINWIKGKFVTIDANVVALKSTMEEGFRTLSEDVKNQTHTLATELKEQRQDFRTFYAPVLMMQQMQQHPLTAPVRAKHSAPKPRSKVKK